MVIEKGPIRHYASWAFAGAILFLISGLIWLACFVLRDPWTPFSAAQSPGKAYTARVELKRNPILNDQDFWNYRLTVRHGERAILEKKTIPANHTYGLCLKNLEWPAEGVLHIKRTDSDYYSAQTRLEVINQTNTPIPIFSVLSENLYDQFLVFDLLPKEKRTFSLRYAPGRGGNLSCRVGFLNAAEGQWNRRAFNESELKGRKLALSIQGSKPSITIESLSL